MSEPQHRTMIEDEDAGFSLQKVIGFLSGVMEYYRLLIVIILLFVCGGLLSYILLEPSYTAIAVIGPPAPSPVSSMIAGQSLGGVTGNLARKLTGGDSSSNDPFEEYLQLLKSARLAQVLAEKHSMLPRVFSKKWDAKNNRWYPPDGLKRAEHAVLRFLNRPVSDNPDSDSLREYLNDHMSVSEAPGTSKSVISAGSTYMNVTFDFRNRDEAEAILRQVLDEADAIIRGESMTDVLARIAYLRQELPGVSEADQRQALITTLSEQEQMKIMLAADKRYATTLVDGPHAERAPTWPPSPARLFTMLAVASVAAWLALLFMSRKMESLAAALAPFGRRRRHHVSRHNEPEKFAMEPRA